MSLRETIEQVLPLVAKPSRYLGNEFHSVRKDPSTVDVQWLLIFPEVYEIGMSHWGLRILYDILNRRADTLAERVLDRWTRRGAANADAVRLGVGLGLRHDFIDPDQPYARTDVAYPLVLDAIERGLAG